MSLEFALEPADGVADLSATIGEVRSGQDQGAVADQVTNVADDASLVSREVGDSLVVLLVAGIAISDDALDLVLDGLGETRDSAVHDSGALAVV